MATDDAYDLGPLTEAVRALEQAEERVRALIRDALTSDPVTGRPPQGRIGQVQDATGWSYRKVKEWQNPDLASRRREQRRTVAPTD
ncbi:hypothetical protein ACIRU3_07115 [Streptomyces sp. NPDC101151]|uniref:hypothetical protein n=1 Tax=Streptomyces sp. NPDC101151 TaxID=3366115 RepID=UPI0038240570